MARGAQHTKPPVPSERQLAETLGAAKSPWDALRSAFAAAYPDIAEDWRYYNAKAGWVLRIQSGPRTLVYLSPRESHFNATFVLGERAVAAAERSGMPEKVLADLRAAKPYVEGRSVAVEVRSASDVDVAMELARIKAAN